MPGCHGVSSSTPVRSGLRPERRHAEPRPGAEQEVVQQQSFLQLLADGDCFEEALAAAVQRVATESEELDEEIVCLEGRAAFVKEQRDLIIGSLMFELQCKRESVLAMEQSLPDGAFEELLPDGCTIATLEKQLATREEQKTALLQHCATSTSHLQEERTRCTQEVREAQLRLLNLDLDSVCSATSKTTTAGTTAVEESSERLSSESQNSQQSRASQETSQRLALACQPDPNLPAPRRGSMQPRQEVAGAGPPQKQLPKSNAPSCSPRSRTEETFAAAADSEAQIAHACAAVFNDLVVVATPAAAAKATPAACVPSIGVRGTMPCLRSSAGPAKQQSADGGTRGSKPISYWKTAQRNSKCDSVVAVVKADADAVRKHGVLPSPEFVNQCDMDYLELDMANGIDLAKGIDFLEASDEINEGNIVSEVGAESTQEVPRECAVQ